jgi:hypothetical protein
MRLFTVHMRLNKVTDALIHWGEPNSLGRACQKGWRTNVQHTRCTCIAGCKKKKTPPGRTVSFQTPSTRHQVGTSRWSFNLELGVLVQNIIGFMWNCPTARALLGLLMHPSPVRPTNLRHRLGGVHGPPGDKTPLNINKPMELLPRSGAFFTHAPLIGPLIIPTP